MKFKKLRFWLAGKILGGMVIEEMGDRLHKEKKLWQEQQLKFGNTVTLEFEVTETGNKYQRKIK